MAGVYQSKNEELAQDEILEMNIFQLAQRYIGIRELGSKDHPLIQWWLSLCGYSTDAPDEVPWCSAFINGMAWELRLPRSKSAAARSWLNVGQVLTSAALNDDFQLGDVVILERGAAPAGHVGLFAGLEKGSKVMLLGGNQGDAVCVAPFDKARIIGVRRLI